MTLPPVSAISLRTDYWDNDEVANIVCRQLGYASGTIYTYGHTSQLPTLPVVAGFRRCTGSESNIFSCPSSYDLGSPGGDPDDLDCASGCLGPDGLQGTVDDTVSHQCQHSVDQGAICHQGDWNPSAASVALPTCQGCGAGCSMVECGITGDERGAANGWCNNDQPVVFSCIDY